MAPGTPLQQIMQTTKERGERGVALSSFKITLDTGRQFIKTRDLSKKQTELGWILVAGLKSPSEKVRCESLFFLRYPQVAMLDDAIEAEVKAFEEDPKNNLTIKKVEERLENCRRYR